MDTFLIKTPPESVFPHGIWIPFATEEEALRQAAWDSLETDRIEAIYRAPGGQHWDYDKDIAAQTLIAAWSTGESITKEHVPYRPAKTLEKLYSTSALAKKATALQKQITEESAQATADMILEIDRAIREGREFKASVPGNAYSICSGGTATGGAIALAAATAKTVLGIAAGASNQASIVEMCVSFDGVTASAVPVLVESVSGTNATNPPGTASTTMTPKQIRGWPAQSSQNTAAYNWTTEPTVLEVFKKRLLTPNGGLLLVQQPMGREHTSIITAATQFKFVGYRLTAPAIVNCHIDAEYEE